MKKLLILDGNSIINRAFYGVRGLSTAEGFPTNALFGFVNIIKRYVDKIAPDYAVCAFDMHHPTFRHEQYCNYKSNRKGMPDELAMQMPYAKKIITALGFTVVETKGYEADDIIGTVCSLADMKGDVKSYILTGDRDSLQLITENTNVILMRNKEDELFDTAHFTDVYGITPDIFVDVKALMGDSSDCIPGVAGIGEKTALKLISQSGGLDALYADAENGYFGSTPSVRKKLDEGREMAYLSRELATICKEAPIDKELNTYEAKAMNRGEMYKLFRELEFGNLIVKFHLSADDCKECEDAPAVIDTSCEVKEVSSAELEAMEISDILSVHYTGEAICFYSGCDITVCKAPSINALKNVFSKRIICHDFKKLTRMLKKHNIVPICEFDIMLAKYLLESGKSVYSLAYIADSLGIAMPEEEVYIPKVISICAEKLGEELNAISSTDLLKGIEIPLAAVLANIEDVGFKVDRVGIKAYAKDLLKAEDDLAASIYMLAGHDFNINSPKQLGTVLFEELGLPSGKKTKTGYSTDADTLQKLRFHHPIISEILSYRQISKLRG
ncbi:MAG: DNA polymerase I, partial [Clostridia bacterium]|nr:DNA polymerase I [Clostridia bacterium]